MTYKPLKIVYQLVVAEENDEGNIVAEHVQPQQTLYAPQFGELESRIEATMGTAPPDGTSEPPPIP
jgi:hypothetical protein